MANIARGRALRVLPLAVLVPIALLLSVPSPHPAAAASKHYVVAVNIRNYTFGKGTIRIARGVSVVWTNRDSDLHTVTSNPGSRISFDSGTLRQGHTFRFTFTRRGTFSYHCAFHAFMHGKVIVS